MPSERFTRIFSGLVWLTACLYGVQAAAQRSERTCPTGAYKALGLPTLPSQFIFPESRTGTQLRNPLGYDESKPLLMIAIGDSVMWGNGLDITHKFVYLAGATIAAKTQREVELRSYAHSGAVLDATFGESVAGSAPYYIPERIRDGVREAKGDLNSALPTIFQQENCAATATDNARAEIVLVDGCINNVGAENIALPFSSRNPKKLNSEVMTGRNAGKYCAKMYELVEQVKKDFPRATIILTNYYQVVTDNSSLLQGFNQFKVGWVLSGMARSVNRTLETVGMKPLFRHISWQINSADFYNNSNRCFGWTVMRANGWLAEGLTASDENPCPSVDMANVQKMQTVRAQENVRVFLAAKPHDSKFGFGIPNTTHLWGLPQEHTFLGLGKGHRDEVYEDRKKVCQAYYRKYFDQMACRISPLAHPRYEGAIAYAKAIAGELAGSGGVIDSAWAMATP